MQKWLVGIDTQILPTQENSQDLNQLKNKSLMWLRISMQSIIWLYKEETISIITIIT